MPALPSVMWHVQSTRRRPGARQFGIDAFAPLTGLRRIGRR